MLKPRDFENRVIPKYFEHSKYSSFIRQANGWGFRRLTAGRDRNAYYHPLFLRGLPHLCKEMKRPGIAEKGIVDPDREPDLAAIAEIYPVPLKSVDEDAILLPGTLREGPNARMPVQSLSMIGAASRSSSDSQGLSSNDHESLNSFHGSLDLKASFHGSLDLQASCAPKPAAPNNQHLQPGTTHISSFPIMFMPTNNNNTARILAAANELAWQASGTSTSPHMFMAGFTTAMAHVQYQQQQFHQQPQNQHQQNNCK